MKQAFVFDSWNGRLILGRRISYKNTDQDWSPGRRQAEPIEGMNKSSDFISNVVAGFSARSSLGKCRSYPHPNAGWRPLLHISPSLTGFAEAGARVGDGECAILPGGNLDHISRGVRRCATAAAARRRPLRRQNGGDGCIVLHICHERCRRVVESHVIGPVQLPQILETGGFLQDVKCIGFAAFASAVVHHRNARW